jgi:hypothetical protein
VPSSRGRQNLRESIQQRDQNLRCHKPSLGAGNINKIGCLQNKNDHEEINMP